MRVALLSDVHANLPALEAVLEELNDVDKILHAGDIVGYNAFPTAVIDRFREYDIESVAGNHDRAILADTDFEFSEAGRAVLEWTQDEISVESLNFLADLPTERRISAGELTVQVVHGSPTKTNEYVYPTDLTMELAQGRDDEIDILVWGHTHYSLVTKIDDVLLINPGSVGQPRDGDWRASYAVIDTGTVELRRLEYDIETARKQAIAESFPSEIIDSLTKES